MALIKCKECGHKISTEALFCPKCGYRETIGFFKLMLKIKHLIIKDREMVIKWIKNKKNVLIENKRNVAKLASDDLTHPLVPFFIILFLIVCFVCRLVDIFKKY